MSTGSFCLFVWFFWRGVLFFPNEFGEPGIEREAADHLHTLTPLHQSSINYPRFLFQYKKNKSARSTVSRENIEALQTGSKRERLEWLLPIRGSTPIVKIYSIVSLTRFQSEVNFVQRVIITRSVANFSIWLFCQGHLVLCSAGRNFISTCPETNVFYDSVDCTYE